MNIDDGKSFGCLVAGWLKYLEVAEWTPRTVNLSISQPYLHMYMSGEQSEQSDSGNRSANGAV